MPKRKRGVAVRGAIRGQPRRPSNKRMSHAPPPMASLQGGIAQGELCQSQRVATPCVSRQLSPADDMLRRDPAVRMSAMGHQRARGGGAGREHAIARRRVSAVAGRWMAAGWAFGRAGRRLIGAACRCRPSCVSIWLFGFWRLVGRRREAAGSNIIFDKTRLFY